MSVVEICEKGRNIFQNFDMFVWTSGFQKSLAQTEFNMFLDEWTSANESPAVGEADFVAKICRHAVQKKCQWSCRGHRVYIHQD